jgi:uncharacterized protein
MGIAVVTGASSGLGAEFARQLQHDDDVDEIWLVARREDRLQQLAKELTAARGVPVVVDLSDAAAVDTLAARIADAGPDLRVLVNNAGYAINRRFVATPLDQSMALLDVNVRALVQLTGSAAPQMTSGARIVQVASSIAFWPMPFFALYSAAKEFVIHFTRSLAPELRDRGIRLLCVCPGPVATEFWGNAGAGKPPPLVAWSARKLVRVTMRRLRGTRWVSTPGVIWWVSAFFSRLVHPRISGMVIRWFSPYRGG